MKAYIIPSLALSLCLLAFTGNAQSKQRSQQDSKSYEKETMVIRKNGKTVVEIKNGKVYVDGEMVANANDHSADKVNKKIIIEGNDDGSLSFFGDSGPDKGNRAMLGVLTDPKAKDNGAYIQRVTPNSAADKAGLRADDVVTAIDGKRINSADELVETIGKHKAGDRISITYSRDGKVKGTNAELGQAGPESMARMFRFGPGGNGMEDFDIPNPMMQPFAFDAANEPFAPTPKLGISAEERADGSGIMVRDVKPGSPAAEAGLQKDDIITRFNDEKVHSIDDLQYMLRELHDGGDATLQYKREGRNMSANVSFPRQVRSKDL
jgi:serine protease Do